MKYDPDIVQLVKWVQEHPGLTINGIRKGMQEARKNDIMSLACLKWKFLYLEAKGTFRHRIELPSGKKLWFFVEGGRRDEYLLPLIEWIRKHPGLNITGLENSIKAVSFEQRNTDPQIPSYLHMNWKLYYLEARGIVEQRMSGDSLGWYVVY